MLVIESLPVFISYILIKAYSSFSKLQACNRLLGSGHSEEISARSWKVQRHTFICDATQRLWFNVVKIL